MSDTPTLTMTRNFKAPFDKVFEAMTDLEKLKQWWGPVGTTIEVKNFELRPGGTFHYCLVTAIGARMWGKFTYLEVDAPKQIKFINSFSDEEGNDVRSPFSPTWPLGMYNEWSLRAKDGETEFHFLSRPFEASAMEEATFKMFLPTLTTGFASTFDKLEQYLAK